MKKDLRGAVLKICKFLGKQLNEKELDTVVEKATFDKMKTDPRANYDSMQSNLLEQGKGHFLRKGTVGDWKNTMTVAQSERFDNVFKEKMKDLSSTFSWDINDDI
ncbi:amine sulfotransferase-like [Terrapene carolina triunguis]|nr:amine sulfotransferase-like [Terrapene carolina triunguis]